ncbi:MAG: Polyribonucleotide nucleotidyltransferase [Parcubacteria group bacterium GW2011_GWA2_43_13]|nr:MAG: Polyribonucleotide nucleotidyltransferase [Parcubacteria group bacterium GW2011_GWA2_43_13]OGY69147.1 MAG: polyribonucleotide nucleotidyltransferase [Candidatus Jacksonbacteria bacterium RIFCSPHIGHO2_02_FULL_43_10]OGY71118.1 MAG: polyribonucleotide nucleotidyltransferase [Candidatus Jacksonbacteria bacterium RIFCSPLOWO2_01_FULL_44_13]HAZ16719.1 polyribonucleotide nucleotidyltransferase [Candidatus Jacksonbacteria bacterium]
MAIQTFEVAIGGDTLSAEYGRLAHQANGSLTMRLGDTVVLATVVMNTQPRDGIDYFPLMVDYEEKLYASGKIKGSRFIKREGRPTDEAVLSGRLIDRAIRPLFPDVLKNDVQVILTVLSQDERNDADIIGLNAASAVVAISDIPWDGPVAAVRVGRIGGEWVLNPSYEARETSDLDLVVAGTAEKVIMLEAGANEVTEDDMIAAIIYAKKHIGKIISFIENIQSSVGKQKIDTTAIVSNHAEESAEATDETAKDTEALKIAEEFIRSHIDEYLFVGPMKAKGERKATLKKLTQALEAYLLEQQIGKDKRKKCLELVNPLTEERVTRAILDEDKRVDGREITEIRSLSAVVGFLPRTHGSGLFQRGETQVLSAVTLGAPGDQQIIDGMEEEYKKRYMHHYNFPPFSVGEASPLRGAGRREIGHGALAERALEPVLPKKEDFPYTMRVVSEVLGSNGSSSMGSVCGSTLALMDAGVPISKPVAGIAMGLASDSKGAWKVLTDLQDMEDGDGGMDFKIAGTKDGITAIQMDTKTDGLHDELIKQTFFQAKEARLKILDVMASAIAEPRAELSQYAPRIYTLHVNPDRIRDIIGPGGKTINEIIDKTGVDIDIEQDGTVLVTGTYDNKVDDALKMITDLTREVVAGEVFTGKVTRVESFGIFVEILPKQDGLVHVSKMGEKGPDAWHVGDPVEVRVSGIDDLGRINLALEGVEVVDRPRPPMRPRSDRFSGGGGRDHHRRP